MADQTQPQAVPSEHAFQVRQVTNIQASWQEQETGKEGLFTLQLILDNGVEEYIMQPEAEDLESLLKLFKISKHTTFDTKRKVLMFSTLHIE